MHGRFLWHTSTSSANIQANQNTPTKQTTPEVDALRGKLVTMKMHAVQLAEARAVKALYRVLVTHVLANR